MRALLRWVRRVWDADALERHQPFPLWHHDGTLVTVCQAGHHPGPVQWPCQKYADARRRLLTRPEDT